MSHARRRLLPSAAAAALLAAAGTTVALAQTAAHTSPKLVSRGTTCVAVAGPGSVMVQVFVHKDNTADVRQVVRSSNHDDDAAALEIARSSTYQAAVANGQPVDEFYDYQLDFTAASPAGGTSADVCAAVAMVRDGQYAGAKGRLTAYLADHPTDRQAYLYLGLANAFSKDAAGATVAFDRAGPIDPKYAAVASQAYVDRAQELFKGNQFAEAAAAAARAIEVQPGNLTAYYLRGVATERSNPAAAIPFLEKARSMATGAKVPAADLARIDVSLVSTYGENGDFDKASALAKEVATLDPAQAKTADDAVSIAYMNSGVALANAGKVADAVARLEAGAGAVPAHAAEFYARATQVLTTAKPPDWKKVKAEADKTLAANPADGIGNFLAAIALANDGKVKEALPFLNRAKTSAQYASDSAFAKQVDDAIKAVGPAAK
ncbi:MAG TPA: tetratricopeptide repeat protein [Caulobacteraceae bacterium]|nr:tetratricopeptide repeat protein [Caulobacteraceae bacterium]